MKYICYILIFMYLIQIVLKTKGIKKRVRIYEKGGKK